MKIYEVLINDIINELWKSIVRKIKVNLLQYVLIIIVIL